MRLLPGTVTADLPLTGSGRTSQQGSRHLIRLIGLAALAFGLALASGLAFHLRGEATSRPAGAASLSALSERAASALVVYSEFGQDADTLWVANPNDPADRTQIGRAEHAPGYGISPSLSPDGKHVAYTVLPAGAAMPELWLLEVKTGAAERLLEAVDLPSAPVWSPASDAVVMRRSAQLGEDAVHVELLRVSLDGTVSVIAAHDSGTYAVGYAPDGAWLYYTTVSAAGTDLWRVANGAPERRAHLSDGIARDGHISPDGTQLSYLAQTSGGATAFTAQLLELSTGQAQPVVTAAGEQFNPVWDATGGITVGGTGSAGVPQRIDMTAGGPAPSAYRLPGATDGTGFDVPLVWSPDGAHLAARHFSGPSAADAGPSQIEVLATDGTRHALSSNSDVAIAGWLEPSP